MKYLILIIAISLTSCEKKETDDVSSTVTSEPTPAPTTSGGYTCVTDKIHSDSAPLFTPPFAHTDLKKGSTGVNTGDANCDVDNDASCNPGGPIKPIGNLYMNTTGLGHIRPTVHSYVQTAERAVNVYTMAFGQLKSITRTTGNEWSLDFSSSCSVQFLYWHLQSIENTQLQTLLEENVPNWNDSGRTYSLNLAAATARTVSDTTYDITDKLELAGGTLVAIKDRSILGTAMDIRVVDTRQTSGNIVGNDVHAWPYGNSISASENLHSVHFVKYFSIANQVKFARYLDLPQASKYPATALANINYGTSAPDVTGKLNGVWFASDVYSYETTNGRFDYAEIGALTFTKSVNEPTDIYMAFGLQAQNSETFAKDLALLDPMGWDPCTCDQAQNACVSQCLNEQKRLTAYDQSRITRYLEITIENNTSRNTDPELVEPGDSICYDLPIDGTFFWYRLYVSMISNSEIRVKLYPSGDTTAQCSTTPTVDMSANYITLRRGTP